MRFYPRWLYHQLLDDLDRAPVVVLQGARQVGKSTLAQEIAERRGLPYRTLDDRDVRERALADPEGLLADLGDGACLDEVQRAPGLLLAVKAVVDRDGRPGRYLLTGSNQPRIAGAVGDSLLGRAAYRTLRPFTLGELRYAEGPAGWDALFEPDTVRALASLDARAAAGGALDWRATVAVGGFPRAVLGAPADALGHLANYVTAFATADIRQLLAIDASDRFERFLRLVATRTGQVLNLNGMCADLGLPVTTGRRWLDALTRSFLVHEVPAWSRNAGSRVTRSPKLFMLDAALAMVAGQEPAATGFHLETLVASDLVTWRDLGPRRAVHHWRTQSKQEVDFIVEQDRRLVAVEVKATTRVTVGDTRHLRTFLDAHDEAVRGVVLSADPAIRALGERVVAVPWWGVV